MVEGPTGIKKAALMTKFPEGDITANGTPHMQATGSVSGAGHRHPQQRQRGAEPSPWHDLSPVVSGSDIEKSDIVKFAGDLSGRLFSYRTLP